MARSIRIKKSGVAPRAKAGFYTVFADDDGLKILDDQAPTPAPVGTGDRGPQGVQGEQGPAGPEGPQGVPGPIGPDGPAGPPGPKGDAGDPGPTGETGAVGSTGPAGPQGEPGADGSTGPQGIQGDVGPQGPKGDTGDAGAAGAAGAEGPQGPQGPQGQQGIQGATGNTGPQGIAGPPGPAATTVYANLVAATALALATNDVVKVTPSATATLTTTVPEAGKTRVVILLQSNTSAKTITFGSGFKPVGTLALGTTANRVFVVAFVSDGTNLYEKSRTAAMAA